MKVLAATADSGTLKEYVFTKDVDTSNKNSEAPSIDVLSEIPSAPKKKQAITHICPVSGSKEVYARKTGGIFANGTSIGQLDSECVGLFKILTNSVVAFSNNGQVLVLHNNQTLETRVRDGLSSIAMHPSTPNLFASAGAEQLPNVFELNIEESKITVTEKWHATQPPNNYLDLPELNLVSKIAFLNENEVVVATSHGKLRVYDTKELSGQPEEMAQASKDGIKALAVDSVRKDTVIIGDSRTTVSRWSVKPFKLLGNYRGVTGSTRAISVRGPYVCTGGLDRYIRVFDIEKRQPAGKVYTGEEIWDLCLVRQDIEEDARDNDELWDRIKRRKISPKEEEVGKESSDEEVEEESGSEAGEESSEESGSEVESDEEESDFEGFDD